MFTINILGTQKQGQDVIPEDKHMPTMNNVNVQGFVKVVAILPSSVKLAETVDTTIIITGISQGVVLLTI